MKVRIQTVLLILAIIGIVTLTFFIPLITDEQLAKKVIGIDLFLLRKKVFLSLAQETPLTKLLPLPVYNQQQRFKKPNGDSIPYSLYYKLGEGLVVVGYVYHNTLEKDNTLIVQVPEEQSSILVTAQMNNFRKALVQTVRNQQLEGMQTWLSTPVSAIAPQLTPGVPIILQFDIEETQANALIYKAKEQGKISLQPILRIIVSKDI